MTNQNEPTFADVVVVGSGPSGAIVSHALAARGFTVVCLEQGDWVNASDFPANNPQWELQVQNQWAHDPNVRDLPADYPLNVADSDMSPVMFNAVGGSTIFYGGQWVRLLPSDFRVRSLDGVAHDWPISYEDLAPVLRRSRAVHRSGRTTRRHDVPTWSGLPTSAPPPWQGRP